MQTTLLVGLLALALSTTGEAGIARKCRRQCGDAVTQCFLQNTAYTLRKCRRLVRRQCKREGLWVCLGTTTTTSTVPDLPGVTTTTTASGPSTTSTQVTGTTVPTTTLPPTLRVRVVDLYGYGVRIAGFPGPCTATLAALIEVEAEHRAVPAAFAADYPRRDCYGPFTTEGIAPEVRSAYFNRIFPSLTTDVGAARLCQDVVVPASGTVICSLFAADYGLPVLNEFTATVGGCRVKMLLGCPGTARDAETCPRLTVVEAETVCAR